jgi:addiction module HigA family antidote
MRAKPIRMGMMPAPPGEFIREEIFAPLGLSISRAAGIVKVRRATLSDIVNGKARLSPEVALRIEKAFGVPMELLLRMQTAYEVAQARARAGEVDVERWRGGAAAE